MLIVYTGCYPFLLDVLKKRKGKERKWLPHTPYRDNNSKIVETFNNCMTTLSKLVPSAGHFAPIDSRLQSKLHEASKEERKQCIETARNACQIVCNVVALKDGDELFNSLRPSNPDGNIPQNVEGLMSAYAKASTSHLKTQILVSSKNTDETAREIRDNH